MTWFAPVDTAGLDGDHTVEPQWEWVAGDRDPGPTAVEVAVDDRARVVLDLLPHPKVSAVAFRSNGLDRGQRELALGLLGEGRAAALHRLLVTLGPRVEEGGPREHVQRALALAAAVEALGLPTRWFDSSGMWPSAASAADAAAVALRRLAPDLRRSGHSARTALLSLVSRLRPVAGPWTARTLDRIEQESFPNEDLGDPEDDTWERLVDSIATAPPAYDADTAVRAPVFRAADRTGLEAADMADLSKLGLFEHPLQVAVALRNQGPDAAWEITLALQPEVVAAFRGLRAAWEAARRDGLEATRGSLALAYGALIARTALPYSLDDLERSLRHKAEGGAPPMLPEVRCEVAVDGASVLLGMELVDDGVDGRSPTLTTYLPKEMDLGRASFRFAMAARESQYVDGGGLCHWLLELRRLWQFPTPSNRRRTRRLLGNVSAVLTELGAERELEALIAEAAAARAPLSDVDKDLDRVLGHIDAQIEAVTAELLEAIGDEDADRATVLGAELWRLRLFMAPPMR